MLDPVSPKATCSPKTGGIKFYWLIQVSVIITSSSRKASTTRRSRPTKRSSCRMRFMEFLSRPRGDPVTVGAHTAVRLRDKRPFASKKRTPASTRASVSAMMWTRPISTVSSASKKRPTRATDVRQLGDAARPSFPPAFPVRFRSVSFYFPLGNRPPSEAKDVIRWRTEWKRGNSVDYGRSAHSH